MNTSTTIKKSVALSLVVSGALVATVLEIGHADEPKSPPALKTSAPPIEKPADAPKKEPASEPVVQRVQINDVLPKGAIARLGSSRFRHDGSPYGAPAFSADGRQVASASATGVFIFELASGQLLQAIRLPDGFHPKLVRFLGDGKRIGVAASDWQKTAELTVYNVADGKAVTHSKFESANSQIFTIDFNADASLVLVEDRFRKVFLWDVKTKVELWSFNHPEASFTLPFTADGKHFILAKSRTAELRETATGKVVAEFPHPGPKFSSFYEAAGIASDGRLAITARDSSAIAVLDTRKEPTVRVLNTERKAVRTFDHFRHLYFSPDGQYVVATGGIQTLVWDLSAKDRDTPIAKFPAAGTCGFSPDGKTLALDDIGCITLWRTGEWKMLPQSTEPPSPVYRVRFSADGKQVIGRTRGAWLSWPASGGPSKQLTEEVLIDFDRVIEFSADGRVAAEVLPEPNQGKGPEKSILRVIDLSTGKERRFPIDISPWSIRLSPDGRHASSMYQTEFMVWDTETGKVQHQQKASASRVYFGADATADGKGLARSASGVFLKDGGDPFKQMYSAVYISDHRIGNDWQMNPIPWSVFTNGARFSPDGTRLVLHARFDENWKETTISVWDVATGQRLADWSKGGRGAAAFLSADGRSLVVGDRNGHLAVVEVATGQDRIEFKHGGEIHGVGLHPAGLQVVASSPDAPVYVWDLLGQPGNWKSKSTDAIWADLGSAEAKTGFAAIRLLRANPGDAIAFLRERMQVPVAPTKEVVSRLLKDLDSSEFAEREKARKELLRIAELSPTELANAMKGNLSAEVREQLEKALKSVETITPERLRQIRACEVLEGIATKDAVKLLRAWSVGPEKSRLAIEANGSLTRVRAD